MKVTYVNPNPFAPATPAPTVVKLLKIPYFSIKVFNELTPVVPKSTKNFKTSELRMVLDKAWNAALFC